jgi:hypothetical protein
VVADARDAECSIRIAIAQFVRKPVGFAVSRTYGAFFQYFKWFQGIHKDKVKKK